MVDLWGRLFPLLASVAVLTLACGPDRASSLSASGSQVQIAVYAWLSSEAKPEEVALAGVFEGGPMKIRNATDSTWKDVSLKGRDH
jgi:hypothetical protein